MKHESEVKDFIQRFVYKPDKKGLFGGQWRILDTDLDAPEGDCEDFALTIAWIMADKKLFPFIRSILNKDVQIWTGTSLNDERHAMLRATVYGKWMWIDNIYKFWMLDTGDNHMEKPYKPLTVLFELVDKRILIPLLLVVVAFIAGFTYDQLF